MYKRIIYLILMSMMALILFGCTGIESEDNGSTTPTYEISSTEHHVDDDVTLPEADENKTDEPAHSKLYLPEYSPREIFEYFEEVVLNTEYFDGTGNTSLVQKWNIPIRYRIYGDHTEDDLAVLNDFFTQLNEVEGFPGIGAADDEELENLTISFLNPEDFSISFSEFINGEDAYGATQFWYYTDTNDIYTANVGYRTDIDQDTRSSILIEEIVNMLGISDTELREDSIVYQYSNDNTALSDVDWVIIKLLYCPSIQCGSDYEQCRECVQQLYY